ncbi:4'-phosphopantetheinyl transferase family protein [Frigoriflavimonas asaccharolytica]|uniref:Phosphopantetheinyl transferase n=1 Tax=Frigoriflavimonas asaccharolytica TaxID=2735899 RepID=A0A8J8G8I0_9FLAO|nr:4'-phosphopantetheinyl transferase superfamily protein [Frigoriflavimonas asaccharolytica]NRS93281.1 phosphopantetheinyl transferase [Frigoriflavimonas asaccharolytica]
MPLYQDFSTDDAIILIWSFDENEEFDHQKLIEPENRARVERFLPEKLAEYLMIRTMLKRIYPDHKILYKTIGQPYLLPKDAFISITHSFPLAALAISKKRIGIDLEKATPKIIRIKEKFLHPNEHLWIPKDHEVDFLTIIWVIKEALYKLHASKYWSLKMHYEVEKFTLDSLDEVKCRVFDDEFEDNYIAKVTTIDDVYFATIEENHKINYKIPRDKKMF